MIGFAFPGGGTVHQDLIGLVIGPNFVVREEERKSESKGKGRAGEGGSSESEKEKKKERERMSPVHFLH